MVVPKRPVKILCAVALAYAGIHLIPASWLVYLLTLSRPAMAHQPPPVATPLIGTRAACFDGQAWYAPHWEPDGDSIVLMPRVSHSPDTAVEPRRGKGQLGSASASLEFPPLNGSVILTGRARITGRVSAGRLKIDIAGPNCGETIPLIDLLNTDRRAKSQWEPFRATAIMPFDYIHRWYCHLVLTTRGSGAVQLDDLRLQRAHEDFVVPGQDFRDIPTSKEQDQK